MGILIGKFINSNKLKTATKVLLPILIILVLGLAYVGKVNENLLTDCHANIQEYINPSWGPGPDGVDVEDKVICGHSLWHNLNPFNYKWK